MSATLLRDVDGVRAPATGSWTLDPAHSAVTFSARHLMVAKVRGRFERFTAEITVGDTPETSSVVAEIEAASLTTYAPQRDAHLRSPDFLDVERFPALRFVSTQVERVGDTRLRVRGDLTIRDITRPVELDVEYLGAGSTPWGGVVAGFSARTEIDREEFGMTWNQALESGGVLVGKKVTIEIEAEAVPASAENAA